MYMYCGSYGVPVGWPTTLFVPSLFPPRAFPSSFWSPSEPSFSFPSHQQTHVSVTSVRPSLESSHLFVFCLHRAVISDRPSSTSTSSSLSVITTIFPLPISSSSSSSRLPISFPLRIRIRVLEHKSSPVGPQGSRKNGWRHWTVPNPAHLGRLTNTSDHPRDRLALAN